MKKCRKCKEELGLENFHPMAMWKYSCGSTCKNCSLSKGNVKIKHKSTTNKNNTAKFTVETKKLIVERDITCVLCNKQGTDVHHVYFSQQCEYWPERNDINKWVLLCRLCHAKCHACASGEWERQEVILYLK